MCPAAQVSIDDAEAMAWRLALEEGLLVGTHLHGQYVYSHHDPNVMPHVFRR